MINNTNASKNSYSGDFQDYKKYIGVASINIVGINPNNEKLRKLGWDIPEGADEPKYVFLKEDGKSIRSTRISFLVQIQDFDDKPIIPINFFIRPEYMKNKTGDKAKIIDQYGRTAWATEQEITTGKIPQYANSTANISKPYKGCHFGEEELVKFLMRYLNVTPFSIFDSKANAWKNSPNPGMLTIDDWKKLCTGDVSELAQYISLQPENLVKVVLGVSQNEDNRIYQTFLNTGYIGNGTRPNENGEYTSARKLIDYFNERRSDSQSTTAYKFSASPVKEWKLEASTVNDNTAAMFDSDTSALSDDDDLPWD